MDWKRFFVLVCLCLLSLGAYAQGAPTATATETNTAAELTIYGSYGNSVLVSLLNLTPFDLTYAYGSLSDQLDRNRKNKKSFMFAPVGLPGTICGTGAYPLQQADGSYQYQFSPAHHTLPECRERLQDATAPVVAPVPFLISWEDDDGLIKKSSLAWTMHDVICNVAPQYVVPGDGCTVVPDFDGTSTYKADIDLGLWFVRSGTDKPPLGKLFADTVSILGTAIALFENPLNPFTWRDAFLAVKHLAEHAQDFDEWNRGDHAGVRMTVRSYPVPRAGSFCAQPDAVCVPQVVGNGANDNVTVQWASNFKDGAGNAEGGVVVVTNVLRSHDAYNNTYLDHNGLLRCCYFKFGSITTVNVTIMTPNQYAAAAIKTVATTTSAAPLRQVLLSNGFGRLRQYLLRHGEEGHLALQEVIRALPAADVELLIQATQTTLTGQLRKEHEEVLRTVAKALDKHPVKKGRWQQ
jgi:hypothetical protein